jgi:hypothetical protein
MKSLFEWVREGNPEYVKNKRKEELEAERSGYQEQLDTITMHRGPKGVQRDTRDPEDARLMDRLTGRIADINRELEELEKGPNPKS